MGATNVADQVERKADAMMDRLNAWIKKYPSLDGMAAGAVAGSMLGPLGTIGGAIVGSEIGHTVGEENRSAKEDEEKKK